MNLSSLLKSILALEQETVNFNGCVFAESCFRILAIKRTHGNQVNFVLSNQNMTALCQQRSELFSKVKNNSFFIFYAIKFSDRLIDFYLKMSKNLV